MIVRLSGPAAAELNSAVAFLRGENPSAATNIHAAIERAVDSLADFPNRGRPADVPGTRELVVRGAPYVLVYSVTDVEVVVFRIRHTSQDPTP